MSEESPMRRLRHMVLALGAALAFTGGLALLGVVPAGGAIQGQLGRPGGAVVLDGSPGVPVADPKTSTVYVPIQCTTSSCTTQEHVVDIVNAATCNTKVISGCRVVARAKVGDLPLAAALDPRTE